jgi:hypothetical protein
MFCTGRNPKMEMGQMMWMKGKEERKREGGGSLTREYKTV